MHRTACIWLQTDLGDGATAALHAGGASGHQARESHQSGGRAIPVSTDTMEKVVLGLQAHSTAVISLCCSIDC